MKIVFKTVSAIILTVIFSGCGGDNSYDGENGLIGTGSGTAIDEAVAGLYANVIIADAQACYADSLVLLNAVQALNSTTDASALAAAQSAFKALALGYKRVESAYVAGYNANDMRDLADFYIEHFIKSSKSQDIPGDLESVFAGTGSLTKNSSKGITALEYTLFGDQESSTDLLAKMNSARLESAVIIAQTVSDNLKTVSDYYHDDGTFLADSEEAVSALLNVLVDNAYKLKEIRIGDPAGYTVKYNDDPDATRLEYYKSINSLEAVKVILDTHKRVMGNGLTEISALGNARSEADAIVTVLDEAIAVCESYTAALEEGVDSSSTQALYNAAIILQNNYTALINALNFTQDIIEADGD